MSAHAVAAGRGVAPSRRRTAASMALVVLVTCLVTGLFVPVARASCVGPTLTVGANGATPTAAEVSGGDSPVPVSVIRGSAVVVRGDFFYDGCADAYSCTAGCGGQSCTANETQTPMREVELTLVVGSSRTSLGTHDADGQGGIVWDGVVPAGTPSGPATLEAEPRDRADPVATLPVVIVAG